MVGGLDANFMVKFHCLTFWLLNSNALFEGKIAQLSTRKKTTIFIISVSNFRIVFFWNCAFQIKQCCFKLNGNRFRFMSP